MYICLDCGKIFETPAHFAESHGFDTPPYEEFDGCPECGGAFVEAFECEHCGQLITGDYIELADGSRYCEECYCFKTVGEDG